MPKVKRIQPKIPELKQKKRVAAYARVSRDGKRLLHSLSAQVSYYSDLIQNNPEWEYAGVYADEAITGTIAEKRDEFQRMIKDCDDGNIDIILTKSISRFARNTVDLLDTVRHLKDIGVEVRFEKEHINTLDGDGELMLTILASFAQEEVRSLSDNVRWARRKKIDAGEMPIRVQVTGYKWKGEKLVIDDTQAAVIRRIFQEYMDGNSPVQICKSLNADGIKTIRGNKYQAARIYQILRNPIYKGDLLLQKTFIDDPITKKMKWNTGELPMVYVEENHEPLIAPSLWDALQEEMKRRKAEWDTGIFDYDGMSDFCHLVKCERTGQTFHHQNNGAKSYGDNDGSYGCGDRDCPYKSACKIKAVPAKALEQACKRAMGTNTFDVVAMRDAVEEITVPKDGYLDVRLKDGTTYHDYFRSMNDTVEKQPINKNCFMKKLVCGVCGHYYSSITGNYNGVRRVTWNCRHNGDNSLIHENILKFRVAELAGWDEFTFRHFKDEVDHIDMDRPCHMVVCFKDGSQKECEYYANETTIRRQGDGKKDNGNTSHKK